MFLETQCDGILSSYSQCHGTSHPSIHPSIWLPKRHSSTFYLLHHHNKTQELPTFAAPKWLKLSPSSCTFSSSCRRTRTLLSPSIHSFIRHIDSRRRRLVQGRKLDGWYGMGASEVPKLDWPLSRDSRHNFNMIRLRSAPLHLVSGGDSSRNKFPLNS